MSNLIKTKTVKYLPTDGLDLESLYIASLNEIYLIGYIYIDWRDGYCFKIRSVISKNNNYKIISSDSAFPGYVVSEAGERLIELSPKLKMIAEKFDTFIKIKINYEELICDRATYCACSMPKLKCNYLYKNIILPYLKRQLRFK